MKEFKCTVDERDSLKIGAWCDSTSVHIYLKNSRGTQVGCVAGASDAMEIAEEIYRITGMTDVLNERIKLLEHDNRSLLSRVAMLHREDKVQERRLDESSQTVARQSVALVENDKQIKHLFGRIEVLKAESNLQQQQINEQAATIARLTKTVNDRDSELGDCRTNMYSMGEAIKARDTRIANMSRHSDPGEAARLSGEMALMQEALDASKNEKAKMAGEADRLRECLGQSQRSYNEIRDKYLQLLAEQQGSNARHSAIIRGWEAKYEQASNDRDQWRMDYNTVWAANKNILGQAIDWQRHMDALGFVGVTLGTFISSGAYARILSALQHSAACRHADPASVLRENESLKESNANLCTALNSVRDQLIAANKGIASKHVEICDLKMQVDNVAQRNVNQCKLLEKFRLGLDTLTGIKMDGNDFVDFPQSRQFAYIEKAIKVFKDYSNVLEVLRTTCRSPVWPKA